LVEAFRSTLEEVTEADLLLHVVDGSEIDADARIDAVNVVLREIGAADVPRLLVWNKSDVADADLLKSRVAEHRGSVAVSATTGAGMPDLLVAIGDRLRSLARIVEFVVPFERGDVLAALHREGEVLVEVHAEGGTRVRARVPDPIIGRFAEFAAQ
ncbi:MAG: GTPase, partial [Actinomycetota bacterium]|nr:GTPase [Actinomycetota bacterium]